MLRDGNAVSHAPDSLNFDACNRALSKSVDSFSLFMILFIDMLSQFRWSVLKSGNSLLLADNQLERFSA